MSTPETAPDPKPIKPGQRYRRFDGATCRVSRVTAIGIYYHGTDVDDGHSPGLFGGPWCAEQAWFEQNWTLIEEEAQ